MKHILFLLAFLLLTATAHADVFDAPCSRYRIPKRLVLAIAKTESGLDPWCVNVAGKIIAQVPVPGHLRLSARPALVASRMTSADANQFMVAQTPEHLARSCLEPRNNATLGVWILAKEIQRHGYNWKAVGSYHSPTPARQKMYAQVVSQNTETLK